ETDDYQKSILNSIISLFNEFDYISINILSLLS
ncbi:unnamed protein product, partial [marine sediment metagenome]